MCHKCLLIKSSTTFKKTLYFDGSFQGKKCKKASPFKSAVKFSPELDPLHNLPNNRRDEDSKQGKKRGHEGDSDDEDI